MSERKKTLFAVVRTAVVAGLLFAGVPLPSVSTTAHAQDWYWFWDAESDCWPEETFDFEFEMEDLCRFTCETCHPEYDFYIQTQTISNPCEATCWCSGEACIG